MALAVAYREDVPADTDESAGTSLDYRSFPREVIGKRIADVLRRTGAFVSIAEVGEQPPDAAAGEVAVANTEPDREQLVAAARGEGASYLILLTINDPRLARTGIEPIAGTLLWLIGGFPSWWVANHTYRMEYGLTAEIHDLASGRDAAQQDFGTMVFEDGVNFVERTNNAGSYMLCWVFPSTFCPVNDDAVASGMSGYVLRERLPEFIHLCDDMMVGQCMEARLDAAASDADGAGIDLRFPRPRVPVMVAGDRVLLDMNVYAGVGETLQRVVVNGLCVFPAVSTPGAFVQPYPRIRVCAPFALVDGAVQIEIVESSGRTSKQTIRMIEHDPASTRQLLRAAH
ncbi:MAG: hypothetical protein AB7K09_00660 [Planctomycetota bacterium]